jgi:hypothetical protein
VRNHPDQAPGPYKPLTSAITTGSEAPVVTGMYSRDSVAWARLPIIWKSAAVGLSSVEFDERVTVVIGGNDNAVVERDVSAAMLVVAEEMVLRKMSATALSPRTIAWRLPINRILVEDVKGFESYV